MDIDELKLMLGLKPLPEEGGFYSEVYRSNEKLRAACLPERYAGDRCFGTAIYLLLTVESFSALHKLASDEVYHFYLGDPVETLLLPEGGSGEVVTIGWDLYRGMRPQLVVPRGTWQGSRVKPEARLL
jgi:predicted cupin superfamily sugar epimerase